MKKEEEEKIAEKMEALQPKKKEQKAAEKVGSALGTETVVYV